MQKDKIKFNYFYIMFQDIVRKEIVELEKNKIGDTAYDLSEIFDFYSNNQITKEEKLNLYNKGLFEVCSNYVSLSNSIIDVYPNNSLEFVDLILDTIHENPYKESFLISLQFIYNDYFGTLRKGIPTLMSSETEKEDSYFQITFDSRYKLNEFESVNMDMVEQNKIITNLLKLELNNQIGPVNKVKYYYRKDI